MSETKEVLCWCECTVRCIVCPHFICPTRHNDSNDNDAVHISSVYYLPPDCSPLTILQGRQVTARNGSPPRYV